MLPTLTASERQHMLQDWNRTQRDYPQSECFPQLFEAQVERTPDAVAVSMGQTALRYCRAQCPGESAGALSPNAVALDLV